MMAKRWSVWVGIGFVAAAAGPVGAGQAATGLIMPPLAQAVTSAPGSGSAGVTEPASSGLAALVAELEQNNPELQAARRDVDARLARVGPAGAPPDPMLSVGYMSGFLRPPFFPSMATPDGARQFGVTQDLPYPGKLRLRSQVALTEVDMARWSYEDVHVRLVAELKTTYFEYVYVDRSLAIIQRNKELLEQMRRIAEARFSVGQAAQQDVLRAQLEISLLLERVAMLEQRRTALQAAVNRLLYREAEVPVDPTLDYVVQPSAEDPDVQALRALAAERAPSLKRDEQAINRGQQALALARKEVLPDFAVNFTSRQQVGGMPWMYGLDVMVNVPIFWQRKQRPMIAEAAAELESSRRMRESTLAMTMAQVTEDHAMATTSRRLMDLYQDSVLPQARLALESSRAAYEVGRVDFLSLITNFITVLDYELGYEAQRAQYHEALARLEPLVGTELVR